MNQVLKYKKPRKKWNKRRNQHPADKLIDDIDRQGGRMIGDITSATPIKSHLASTKLWDKTGSQYHGPGIPPDEVTADKAMYHDLRKKNIRERPAHITGKVPKAQIRMAKKFLGTLPTDYPRKDELETFFRSQVKWDTSYISYPLLKYFRRLIAPAIKSSKLRPLVERLDEPNREIDVFNYVIKIIDILTKHPEDINPLELGLKRERRSRMGIFKPGANQWAILQRQEPFRDFRGDQPRTDTVRHPHRRNIVTDPQEQSQRDRDIYFINQWNKEIGDPGPDYESKVEASDYYKEGGKHKWLSTECLKDLVRFKRQATDIISRNREKLDTIMKNMDTRMNSRPPNKPWGKSPTEMGLPYTETEPMYMKIIVFNQSNVIPEEVACAVLDLTDTKEQRRVKTVNAQGVEDVELSESGLMRLQFPETKSYWRKILKPDRVNYEIEYNNTFRTIHHIKPMQRDQPQYNNYLAVRHKNKVIFSMGYSIIFTYGKKGYNADWAEHSSVKDSGRPYTKIDEKFEQEIRNALDWGKKR